MPLPSVIDEIDRLFDELVRRPWGSVARQVVATEVHEVEDGWVVKLPVEGLTADDLQMHVEGHRLTITGHRRQARERRGKAGWTQHEIAVHRTLALPAEADPENIDAEIEDSTLTLHIHRRQP